MAIVASVVKRLYTVSTQTAMKRALTCFLLLTFGFPPTARALCAGDLNNIRLNKVFKETHSRRQADSLIEAGRVKVNGSTVGDMGRRVVPYQDNVELDGRPYTGWEKRHGFTKVEQVGSSRRDSSNGSVKEDYIKFYKPIGITSTTDRSISGNLLDAINDDSLQRIFSVGRLDKDSSGLILLTSDGRLPNSVLRKEFKRPKKYVVSVDRAVADTDIALLQKGLLITTDRVRQKRHERFTARTLPCTVDRHNSNAKSLTMTLTEGRNRQIRVMLKTLGYNVLSLHRTEFMGIDLRGLKHPGDWKYLDMSEMEIVRTAIRSTKDE